MSACDMRGHEAPRRVVKMGPSSICDCPNDGGAHGARYHPLGEKPQQRFAGRLALGLEPIGDSLEQALKAAAE